MGIVAMFVGALVPRAWQLMILCVALAVASAYAERTMDFDATPFVSVAFDDLRITIIARTLMMWSVGLSAWYARRRIAAGIRRNGFPQARRKRN